MEKKENKQGRKFQGGAKYLGLVASETATTKATAKGFDIQVDTYQNLDEIVKQAWNAVKSKPYIKLNAYSDYTDCQANLNAGKTTKIQFANGLQVVHIAVSEKKQTEQSGYARFKGRVYCPQLDKHLGSDSITTFKLKCLSFESQLKKLGLL